MASSGKQGGVGILRREAAAQENSNQERDSLVLLEEEETTNRRTTNNKSRSLKCLMLPRIVCLLIALSVLLASAIYAENRGTATFGNNVGHTGRGVVKPHKEGGKSANDTTLITVDTTIIKHPGKYILGFSTGHAGSTTVHSELIAAEQCPFDKVGTFEAQLPQERDCTNCGTAQEAGDECSFTRDNVFPFLESKRGGASSNKTWVDLGHYHNRGTIIECLASQLKSQSTFVHIRRNRYHIARSFSNKRTTPCKLKGVGYCPTSENQNYGNGFGTISDDGVWERLTAFQKFLWYADDVEYRYHKIRQQFGDAKDQPHWIEITWTTAEEIAAGVEHVKARLGCNYNASIQTVTNHKSHQRHDRGTWDCIHMIAEDLEYRKLMNFTTEQRAALFGAIPQRLDGGECNATRQSLWAAIQQDGEVEDKVPKQWVLPDQ